MVMLGSAGAMGRLGQEEDRALGMWVVRKV